MKPLILAVLGLLVAASPPRADQHQSIHQVLDTLYGVISGPVGQKRDWPLFKSLFLEQATLRAVRQTPDGPRIATMTPDDYISNNGPVLERIGFIETELQRRVYTYGNIATVLSAYKSVRSDQNVEIGSGINSITLAKSDAGWKIASIVWQSATPDLPLESGFRATNPIDLKE